MEVKVLVGVCVLVASVGQVLSSAQPNSHNPNPAVLFPWRPKSGGLGRVKRDWIIPPIRVSENSKQVPEYLVQIKSDKVFTGEVIYKLEGPGVDQEPKDLFEIDDKTGWIKSKMPLDREKHKSFTLKAFALSPSGQRLENPTTIEIYILDQNDNRPNFIQEEFVGSVPEFSIPGTSVLTVSAVDADDPETDNALLSYFIVAQESFPPFSFNKTMFGINNETGVIYTRDVGLDRDVVQSFRLTLQVADMSGEGLTGMGRAVIHVTDINNHAPQFKPNMYNMFAMENKRGVEVGRVNATDRDQRDTDNWRIFYSITRGDPSGNFAISTDPTTNQGIISVVKPLDYESQSEYKLVVTGQNEVPLSFRGPYQAASSATVTVRVLNENEAPLFYKNPIRVSVPESISPGTVLTSDIAHDPDNAKLRFELSQDPEMWLSIDKETGEITARKTFSMRSSHVKNNKYTAVVKVTDLDADGLSASAVLEITLWETNDFAPGLLQLNAVLCSDREPHRRGLMLSAEDQDASPHADPYTFLLTDTEAMANWTLIPLNETHAMLQPLVDVDWGEFAVAVSVSDSGSPARSSSSLLNVTVCPCDRSGQCTTLAAAAIFGNKVGISFLAVIIIVSSGALLLLLLFVAVAVRSCTAHTGRKAGGLLVGESDDDIRDNVFNYDEQGGGEEDEDAFNIDLLRPPNDMLSPRNVFNQPGSGLPKRKQPLRRDAPYNMPSPTYPRKAPGDPTDIEDFINDGLDVADNDPNAPPYDTALIYDYEGDGSVAGSLSSIASTGSDEDQDYDYLNDWGPRFKKLANLYEPR